MKTTFLSQFWLWIDKHQSQFDHGSTVILLRRSLYLIMLLALLLKLPILSMLYSPEYLTDDSNSQGFTPLFSILFHPPLNETYIIVTVIHGITLIAGLFGLIPRISSLILLCTHGIYCISSPETSDAGDSLTWIFLCYLSLIKEGNGNPFENTLSYAGFYLARLQLCFLYVGTALSKIPGELWQKGVALFYILKIPEFTIPLAEQYLSNNELFIVGGTYATLLFQLLFPTLIWHRTFRRLLIILGSMIHLQIALVMGLPIFGFSLTCFYIVFYDESYSKRIISTFQMLRQRIQPPPGYLVVAFDHHCKKCMIFAHFIEVIAKKDRLIIEPAHNPKNLHLAALSLNSRLDSLKAYRQEDGKILSDWAALTELFRSSLIMLPFYLTGLLLQKLRLGPLLYQKLIVESQWRQSCQSNKCSTGFVSQKPVLVALKGSTKSSS